MAAILVDYENVGNANGLRGVDVLQETDTLVIFYSGCCGKIRYDYMQETKCSGCRDQKGSGSAGWKYRDGIDFFYHARGGSEKRNSEKQNVYAGPGSRVCKNRGEK